MNTAPANQAMGLDQSINQARDFLSQYYSDTTNHEKPDKEMYEREQEVMRQLRYTVSLTTREGGSKSVDIFTLCIFTLPLMIMMI